jgi:acetylornithine deacetylase
MHQAGQTPDANLIIAATVDEEVTVRGAPAFANWVKQHQLPLDQLAVAEPTRCRPVYGHKGVCRLEFEVQGKSTHTSQPQLGLNAITAAAQLVLALDEEHNRLLAEPPQTELGPPTLTVSIVQGGSGINVVPDSCRIWIDRRIVAGEKPAEVAAALRKLANRVCPLPVTTQEQLLVNAFFQPSHTP